MTILSNKATAYYHMVNIIDEAFKLTKYVQGVCGSSNFKLIMSSIDIRNHFVRLIICQVSSVVFHHYVKFKHCQ